MEIKIKDTENGYILEKKLGWQTKTYVYTTIEDLLNELLFCCEYRAPTFTGDMYGKVNIDRGENEK